MGFFDGIGKPIKKVQPSNKSHIETASFKGVRVIYGTRKALDYILETDGGYARVNGIDTIAIINTKKGDRRLLNHEYAHYLWHKKLGSTKKTYWTQIFYKYKNQLLKRSFQFAAEEFFAIYYAYIKTGIIPSHQNHPVSPELVKACKKIIGS